MLYYTLWATGPQNSQKCRNHLQHPSARGVTWSKFYTVNSHFWRDLWTSLLSGIPVFRICAHSVWSTQNVIKSTTHKNKYTISYPSSWPPFWASSTFPALKCTTFQNLAQKLKEKKNIFRFQAGLLTNHRHTPSKTNINKAQQLLIPHCFTFPHSKLLPKWLLFKQKQYMLVTMLV